MKSTKYSELQKYFFPAVRRALLKLISVLSIALSLKPNNDIKKKEEINIYGSRCKSSHTHIHKMKEYKYPLGGLLPWPSKIYFKIAMVV